MSKPQPPITLDATGKSLWGDITSVYDLRADELATLEDACALSDMISALEKAWIEDGKPLTTKGSMGQQVTHPLISEIRTHRMARVSLLKSLKLPDENGAGDTGDRSTQARAAANARWANRGA